VSNNRAAGKLSVAGKVFRRRSHAGRRSGNAVRRLVLLAGAAVVSILLGWTGKVAAEQLVPRRVVVRGCWLTNAQEVLAAIGFNGLQSVAEVRQAAREFDLAAARWIRRICVSQDSLATALVSVDERNPLLLLKINGDEYWLCDDGAAIAREADQDSGQIFDAILKMPMVVMQLTDLRQLPELATPALLTAALCHEVLPGDIRKIAITASGEVDLYDHSGFRIRLGQPTMLEEKIGALPKALRICEQKGAALQYLDARDPQVFYEKWKEPISN
jgi:cell division septal protein FtsQ